MRKSVLVIRDEEYALPEVELTGDHAVMEGEHIVSFSLSAVAGPKDNGAKAGLAINCIAVQGVSNLIDLQGQRVALGEGEANSMNNELNESVIVEQGNTLELEHLTLRFGELTNDHIDVRLEAVCFRFAGKKKERHIPVRGHLWARVGKCRERLTL